MPPVVEGSQRRPGASSLVMDFPEKSPLRGAERGRSFLSAVDLSAAPVYGATEIAPLAMPLIAASPAAFTPAGRL